MFGQRHDPALTPAMEHAQRELDTYLDNAYGAIREVDARREELERAAEREREPLSDDGVARFEALISGHAATEEWQRVIARIDRGELTWRQVVDGLASGDLDRDTAAAFESLARVPPVDLADLTAADAGSAESGAEPAAEEVADDDYYENFSLNDSSR